MTNKEIHENCTRLLEGQTVIIDDVKVKAVEVTEKRVPCFLCKFFNSCTNDMNEVCVQLEMYNDNFYRLDPIDDDNEDRS